MSNGFNEEKWAVIYFHELGHKYGDGPRRLHHQYHEFRLGDQHCPYNCIMHHYVGCGNIAVGKEQQVFDYFTKTNKFTYRSFK
jgi:hypothetical protein